ncbi:MULTISPECIES: transglutaminase domain-containing protein [Cohnella]|uniref:transglutaminase domain-containing protein n=1 Tax=Cohnella TaxID=329857 RepID=UPI000E3725C2|nr:transglutaminase domain-containing protein [Cohnella sp.]REK63679.1 MAG: cysteine protease [Cohnella sp.]
MNSLDANWITVALLVIVAVSLLQGLLRGAKGTARQLFGFVAGAAFTLLSIGAAAWAAAEASPRVQAWLAAKDWAQPKPDASSWIQLGYTLFAGMRDLPLLRFSVLMLIFYFALRLLCETVISLLIRAGGMPFALLPSGGAASRVLGGAIGAALGCGRALLVTAVLFAYCSLWPKGPYADYIQQSGLYRQAASQIIEPAAGALITERLPVFAAQMQSELNQLWQKRYDVIDADLPEDIVSAAVSITEGAEGDKAKARALYDWVGSRIAYDNDKVIAYEQRGEWREQTPEDTFRTRKGVCIDYARLYAAMARAVGLNVRVVTGLGYDGRGGYGPHAWNEVWLSEENRWAPLDATWASTGDWFDPEGFQDTHIRQA